MNPLDRSGTLKFSLPSALLAARRGGVVVPLQNVSTYLTAGAELTNLYTSVASDYCPEYLLIGGTPGVVPFGVVSGLSADPEWANLMTDATYANIDADTFLEIAVGRLIANNLSEGTLIASRISTYELLKDGYWENRFAEMGRWGMFESVPTFENMGFTWDDLMGAVRNNAPPIEDGLILHNDHSGYSVLGYAFEEANLNTLLAPALIVSRGCGTAGLDKAPNQVSESLLRQGAVAFMGGPRNLQGMSIHLVTEIINAMTGMESLGAAYRRGFNSVSLNVLDDQDYGSNVTRYNWILIGDPALVIHMPTLPAKQPAKMVRSTDNKTLTISAPETWWSRPYPASNLIEWGWTNTLGQAKPLYGINGAGTSIMGHWGGAYDVMKPLFTVKYRTSKTLNSVTQQSGILSPLGWSGSFASNVHVDQHRDGTKTYLWRVRMMDYNHETGATNGAISSVEYSLGITNPDNPNSAPVWASNPVVKMNGRETVAYSGSLREHVTDADGDPLVFVKTGGASWLNVDLDGTLRGTPDVAGTNTATVTVSDEANSAVAVTVQIVVDPMPPPMVISQGATPQSVTSAALSGLLSTGMTATA